MKHFVPAILLVLLASGVAMAEDIAPERIIDATTGDWDRDGNTDMAMLVGPKEQGDDIAIYIYLRDKDHDLLKLVTTAPAKVSGNASLDGMFGQDPFIKGMPNGSIAVHSGNSGVGRDRWDQTLTLAYRNSGFIVAGYTYNYYDALDPDHNGSCDYNLLTGKVTNDKKESEVEPKSIKIEDWDDQVGQQGCGIKQD